MVFKSVFHAITPRVFMPNSLTCRIFERFYVQHITYAVYSVRIIFNLTVNPTSILFDCVRNQNEIYNLLRVRKVGDDEEKIQNIMYSRI